MDESVIVMLFQATEAYNSSLGRTNVVYKPDISGTKYEVIYRIKPNFFNPEKMCSQCGDKTIDHRVTELSRPFTALVTKNIIYYTIYI